jgi:hypothetical protein
MLASLQEQQEHGLDQFHIYLKVQGNCCESQPGYGGISCRASINGDSHAWVHSAYWGRPGGAI